MSKVSLRRLLSRLTALALSTSAVSAAGLPEPDSATSPAAPTAPNPGAPNAPDELEALEAELDASLPIERDDPAAGEPGAALGRGLAMALGRVRPLAATHLAASWALAAEPLRRLAIAHALGWVFPLVGDGAVLEHLARDPDPAIRLAVARAAWARRTSGGDLGVLATLAGDPDPAVRAVAAAARWA